jgi:hypothetical protein
MKSLDTGIKKMENDSYENVFRYCEKTLRGKKNIRHNEAVDKLASIVAEADKELVEVKRELRRLYIFTTTLLVSIAGVLIFL